MFQTLQQGSWNQKQLTQQLGPGCSKLTTSLVNGSLKFPTLISQIHQYFCWKNVRGFWSAKASLIFSTKNITVFRNKVVKHLTSWSLNGLVKLTMLWTTGPWWDISCSIPNSWCLASKQHSWKELNKKHVNIIISLTPKTYCFTTLSRIQKLSKQFNYLKIT